MKRKREKSLKVCFRKRSTDGLDCMFDVGLLISSPEHVPWSSYFWATLGF